MPVDEANHFPIIVFPVPGGSSEDDTARRIQTQGLKFRDGPMEVQNVALEFLFDIFVPGDEGSHLRVFLNELIVQVKESPFQWTSNKEITLQILENFESKHRFVKERSVKCRG